MTEISIMTQTESPDVKICAPCILVVEDDVNLLEGIRNILEIDGYRVLTAEHGREALSVLRNQPVPPDLIVSDIMMPHMSGIQLLEAVRQESRWLSIPFIFLTARGEKSDIQRGKQLGVEDYIVKPYDPLDLMITIRSRIRRSEEIEAVHVSAIDQVKRNILTILNHEFRTPLTFVVAYADMLTMPTPDQMDGGEMVSYLKGISSGAERLRNLIENFILLVELETGEARQTFDWRKHEITDVRTLLEVAWDGVANREGVEHTCIIDVADPLPVFIGDEDYLRRAVQQLLNNAVKFSPVHMPLALQAYAQGGDIVIEVEDQGRGIPAEELDNIWDSFYQIDRNFYEDQGAGSGLAIVKRVAELHGGHVTAESEFGRGSRFSLRLPVK
ncbi:MAG: hybrid sensor histidine kinase/response regulator [Anaerolineae bacterium]|nr:hybrid sensor histidine kinase/response regulator [Anaerolineae bacterium]